MSDDTTIDALLLDRYVNDECDPDERRIVECWIGSDASRAEQVAMLRAVRAKLRANTAPRTLTDAIWAAVNTELASSPARRRRVLRLLPRERRGPPRWWVAVAASVVVAMAGVVGLRYRSSGIERTYATAAGERLIATLSDGSVVTLAPRSRLTIGRGFGASRRDVRLEGEGFFAVVHDPRRPFVVHAGHALTTDVGTAFDVRAYPSDPNVRVVVSEGKVGVQGTGRTATTLLGAAQVVTVDGDAHVGVAQPADVVTLTGWRDGRLVFHREALSVIVVDLARWYDLDITLDDPALGRRHQLTADWTNLPADQVLGEIAATVGARVTRQGRRVVFTSTR